MNFLHFQTEPLRVNTIVNLVTGIKELYQIKNERIEDDKKWKKKRIGRRDMHKRKSEPRKERHRSYKEGSSLIKSS